MRASPRAFLALLCASAGCLGQGPDDGRPGPSEPFGGPTSDWPGRDRDRGEDKPEEADDDESASDDDADPNDGNGKDDMSSEPGTKPTPGKGSGASKDAGAAGRADGGAARPPDSMADAGIPNAGGDSSASDADAGGDADGGRYDGGDTDGGRDDGGTQADAGAGDGGAFGECTSDSDRRGFGACYGLYCAMTPGEIAEEARIEGACASDLALACDGEIARVVSECAEANVLALGAWRAVSRCAERTASLSEVSAACLDCYVDEVLCAATSCLSECLSSDDAQSCSTCRLTRCGDAFRACSGLPAPARR